MALKFRRGTTAQKSGSLAFGEPYVNTSLQTLQIGLDGGDVTLSAITTGSNLVVASVSGEILATNGVVSGSSQLTTDFDARYLNTSGDSIVSGSSQVTLQSTTGFSAFDTALSTISGSLISSASAAKTTNDSQDVSISNLNTFSSSQLTKDSDLATYTGSVNTKLTEIGVVSGSLISSASTAKTTNDSQGVSITNLNTYTGSLKDAIQLTGSTVSFLGNIVVYGTQSIINSTNLAVSDNMIYLNNESTVTDPDLGIAGNYNDGTYAHTGIFSDASDGHAWKVFKGYTPEPSGTIDTSHGTFALADFKAGTITGTTFIGSIAATNGVVSGSSQIDHNSTTNYSANRHIDHTEVTLTAGSGLTGGGDISTNRTFTVGAGSYITVNADDVAVNTATLIPAISGTILSSITGDVTITAGGVATIGANSVALGTDTTGDYVASLVAGTGVTLSNNSGESATPTIAIGQAVATTSTPTFGNLTINGTITATGDITAYYTSDRRHKNNIQTISNAVLKVKQLNGVTWEWNDDVNEVTKSTPKTGLIAQEVQSVLPQVVTERADGFLALDYSKMVGLLVEAIKEQQIQIDQLKAQIGSK
jgi:hypothetical protein